MVTHHFSHSPFWKDLWKHCDELRELNLILMCKNFFFFFCSCVISKKDEKKGTKEFSFCLEQKFAFVPKLIFNTLHLRDSSLSEGAAAAPHLDLWRPASLRWACDTHVALRLCTFPKMASPPSRKWNARSMWYILKHNAESARRFASVKMRRRLTQSRQQDMDQALLHMYFHQKTNMVYESSVIQRLFRTTFVAKWQQ